MKQFMFVISLLAIGMASAYSQTPQAASVRPKSGFVPDSKTAGKIGRTVLVPVYGETMMRNEEPFKAKRVGDVCTVEGTLNCGAPQCAGGQRW
jgi:hypothetical protein